MRDRFQDLPDPSHGYVSLCGRWFNTYSIGVAHERNCARCHHAIDDATEDEPTTAAPAKPAKGTT